MKGNQAGMKQTEREERQKTRASQTAPRTVPASAAAAAPRAEQRRPSRRADPPQAAAPPRPAATRHLRATSHRARARFTGDPATSTARLSLAASPCFLAKSRTTNDGGGPFCELATRARVHVAASPLRQSSPVGPVSRSRAASSKDQDAVRSCGRTESAPRTAIAGSSEHRLHAAAGRQ